MDDNEIRIKIAELQGWKWHEWPDGNGGTCKALRRDENVIYGAWVDDGRVLVTFELPDWPNDIAAAFELVGEIPDDVGRRSFVGFLMQLTWTEFYQEDEPFPTLMDCWRLAHATPRQICEAWIGWKDRLNATTNERNS